MVAKGKARVRGERARREEARESIGAWANLAFEKIYGNGNEKFSAFDVLLRKEFNRALDGNLQAIKVLLRMAKANMREAGPRIEIVRGELPDPNRPPQPVNAELAYLILGIGVVENEALKWMPGDFRKYEIPRLKATHIANWVVEAALVAPD